VVGPEGENIGVVSKEEALRLAIEKGLDLIEIAPTANPPVAKIIGFDKFRYQKEKEEKKKRFSQKSKELKHVRITPRAALNDLQIKARLADEFLAEGHKVEIGLFLRGREKANRAWNLQKLNDFMNMIKMPFKITSELKAGGRGIVAQIVKK